MQRPARSSAPSAPPAAPPTAAETAPSAAAAPRRRLSTRRRSGQGRRTPPCTLPHRPPPRAASARTGSSSVGDGHGRPFSVLAAGWRLAAGAGAEQHGCHRQGASDLRPSALPSKHSASTGRIWQGPRVVLDFNHRERLARSAALLVRAPVLRHRASGRPRRPAAPSLRRLSARGCSRRPAAARGGSPRSSAAEAPPSDLRAFAVSKCDDLSAAFCYGRG